MSKNANSTSGYSKTALLTLPSLQPSDVGASSGNVTQNCNVTNVTETTEPIENVHTSYKKSDSNWPDMDTRPCWKVYDDWITDSEGVKHKPGVWYHCIEGKGDDKREIDTWVSTPLHVEAIAANDREMDFGRLLRVTDRYGNEKEWTMPMTMLKGSGEEFRGALLSLGLEYSPRHRSQLIDYIFSQNPKRRVISVNQTGWSKPGLFVLPDCSFGEGDIVFQNEQAGLGDYSSGGDFEGWTNEIGMLCQGNPILILAVCTALAGPLLQPLHKGNGGFHFLGDSSCGKSTAMQVACSVYGKADPFIKTWRATGNGLEGIASLRNDTILVLDEIGEADPREVGAIVYSMGNGTGKQRANVRGNARTTNKWRLLLLSSGERSLEAIMNEGNQRVTAGQQIRLLDIPVTGKYGAFDCLHGAKSGREFSDSLKTASNVHYGHLGRAFLRCLVKVDINQIGQLMETFKSSFDAEPGQEGRAADRFALVAVAGELAIDYKLLPWKRGDALQAVATLFTAWKLNRGQGKTEDRQILQMISDYISRYGDSRFTNLSASKTDPGIDTRLNGGVRSGYWVETPDGDRTYRFTPDGLKLATKGQDFKRVKQSLRAAGWMEGDTAQQVKTPEGNRRLYPPLTTKGFE